MAIKKRKEDHLNEDARGRLRFRPLSGDNPSNDIMMEAENNQLGGHADVGQLLKQTRIGLGQTVEDVCQLLRIRKIYVEAIENGEYSLLPNGPYGIGFVKAYAEHLGLDGSEIARRFREENNAPAARTQLTFPKPVQESRVPGGAVLLIAALLGIGAYGGWYYLSSQGKTIADLVDPLPERLASYTTSAPKEPEPRTLENAAEARAAEAPVSSTDTSDTANEPAGVETPVASSATTPEGEGAGSNDVAVVETAPETAAAPVEEAENTAADVAEQPVSETAQAAPAAEPQAQVAQTPETAPAAPAAEVASVPAVPDVDDAGGARVFGSVNVDSRVTISATETSWVRIREADGNVLLTRMLTAGDTYRVPNRDGLKLEVGNAGALTYSIDGNEALPVGEYGAVISDFSLNVDDLTDAETSTVQ